MNNEPNISLYGDAAGEEFPVLKAFQQYIDAEQAKARKRLLTVSIVFVVTLISVIAIFSFLIAKANNQTQTLNDRLVEYAMKDKDRSVEVAKSAAIQEATVKSLNETLEKLKKQIDEQDRKATAAAAAAAKELAEAKAAAESPAIDPVVEKRNKDAEARIQKALALLKSEKEKLANEKEKLRQEELERYRRQHYPEYYAKKEAKKTPVKSLQTFDEDLDDIEEVTYFDEEEAKPVKSEKKAKPMKKAEPELKTKPIDLDEDPIEYFKNTETYTIPVEVKGKRAGWRVPLD